MANFPNSVPSFATLVDNVDDVLAAHQNEPNAEITAISNFLIATATEKTVASGVLTVDKSRHKIQPQSGTADDIDTISGMPDSSVIYLYATDAGTDNLTFKHGTGNLSCFGGSDIILSYGFVICFRSGSTIYIAGGGGATGTVDGVIQTKYIITPSVSSNNLTLAMKYIDGNDPSSSNKLVFRVGNTNYSLTASMSFTKNAGTNWGNSGSTELAAKNIDYFVYAIGETGGSAGLKFGFSRIPYATTMGDFVNTTTNEKYIAGNWTNFNSTDAVTNIGRFRAQLSATASFNWSIPSAKVVNFPIYNTDRLDFNASWTGFSAAPSDGVQQYILQNEMLTLYSRNATNGTSNAVTLYLVSPFSTPNITNALWTNVARGTDNGAIVTAPLLMQILANSNSIVFRKSFGSGSDDWTNSGGKNIISATITFPLR